MCNHDKPTEQEGLLETAREYLRENNLNLSKENRAIEITVVFRHFLDIGLINEGQYNEILKIIST